MIMKLIKMLMGNHESRQEEAIRSVAASLQELDEEINPEGAKLKAEDRLAMLHRAALGSSSQDQASR